METSEFYPERGGDVTGPKAVCERCPVADACLTVAETRPREHYGIWGGFSARERVRLRRAARRALERRQTPERRQGSELGRSPGADKRYQG